MTSLEPDQRVLDLVVELAGLTGRNAGPPEMPVKFVMSMFGSPVVISLTLMPRMPSDSADRCP